MIYFDLTDQQVFALKKALKTKDWRKLKTWKEKTTFQYFCKNHELIREIAGEARKVPVKWNPTTRHWEVIKIYEKPKLL